VNTAMHMGLRELAAFFRARREAGSLVMVTVVETRGSTYRKPGALMLIDAQGQHAGLISGGCLEADLAQRAKPVFADGQSRAVVYDLHDDEGLVLGLGLGCGGEIELHLGRVRPGAGFNELEALFGALDKGYACDLFVGLDEDAGSPDAGLWLAIDRQFQNEGPLAEPLSALAREDFSGRSRRVTVRVGDQERHLLQIRLTPPPRILLCGAGPDAPPLAAQVLALGWDCVVTDHRSGFATSERFPAAAEVLCQRPAHLADGVDLNRIDAAVVMSHHLEHDADYLKALSAQPPAYIGLLGPAARREALQKRLGNRAPSIQGPAGLNIGAEGPESIALSIMAEIHARLNQRDGGALSRV